MVGKKEYPYTPKGIAMAKAAAKKEGTKMKMKKGYAMGGMTGAYNPVQADMQRQQGMMQAQQPAKPAMKSGGMMNKKGYAKGGKTYANCGASVPGTQGKNKK
jgi:hypothetical protein